MRAVGRLLRLSPPVTSLVALGFVWELAGRTVTAAYLPPLSAVLSRLWVLAEAGEIGPSLVTSLVTLVLGFGLALALGLVVGVLMGTYPRVEAALDVYVNALLTAPSLVFAPIFFSIWGLGRGSVIAVVVMYSTFIIMITVASAIRTVSPALVEMGRTYCATDMLILRRIVLPAATPLMMAGIRLGAGRAVKGMINGEMFIALVGLGKLSVNEGRRFDSSGVLAVLIVILIVALVAAKLVEIVDARLTRWLPSVARAA